MAQANILIIGVDAHKEFIVISLADDDRSEVRRYGLIGGTLADCKKMLINRTPIIIKNEINLRALNFSFSLIEC